MGISKWKMNIFGANKNINENKPNSVTVNNREQ